MKNCKYYDAKTLDGISHEFCTNEELNKINKRDNSQIAHSNDKHIPCFGNFSNCGKFEQNSIIENEETL